MSTVTIEVKLSEEQVARLGKALAVLIIMNSLLDKDEDAEQMEATDLIISTLEDKLFIRPAVGEVEYAYKNWGSPCCNCGDKPTVGDTGLCGPCCFGEAETVGGNW